MRKLMIAVAGLVLLAGCMKVDKTPPANMPPYAQLYPGSTPIMHIDVAGMTTIEAEATATPDDVVGYYRTQATSNGLQETATPSSATAGASADQRTATFADAATGRMLIVIAKPQGAQTLISVAYKAVPAGAPVMSLYDIEVAQLDGKPVSLGDWRGQVLLIVNVASRCGFTPQYTGLEALYREHHAQGFSVLGFPCNQFGGQEPGDAAEIASFCSTTYDVSFPVMAKIEVNGANTHPLYNLLKHEQPGLLGSEAIKWNFTKFFVDRKGAVVKRFAPNDTPAAIEPEIEALI